MHLHCSPGSGHIKHHDGDAGNGSVRLGRRAKRRQFETKARLFYVVRLVNTTLVELKDIGALADDSNVSMSKDAAGLAILAVSFECLKFNGKEDKYDSRSDRSWGAGSLRTWNHRLPPEAESCLTE